MSHFAEIDENGVVKRVIVAEKNFINTGYVGDEFNWIQTSYNGSFRKRFAGVGFTYDKVNDVFVEPKPYPSWTLDASHDWQPPTPRPVDGKAYSWNEGTQALDEIS